MAFQNRVDPWGELHAVPSRGTMLGNRGGKFHRNDKTLSKRRWATHHWIACELHYKNMHHEAMGPGYTSLFFLDEVTALAAGHRPCFFCRRQEAKAFLDNQKVDGFDRKLHQERLSAPLFGDPSYLPDGGMVEWNGAAYACKNGKLLRWSFDGYDAVVPMPREARILTPTSIVAILAKGYKPRWHHSISRDHGQF